MIGGMHGIESVLIHEPEKSYKIRSLIVETARGKEHSDVGVFIVSSLSIVVSIVDINNTTPHPDLLANVMAVHASA